MAELGQHRLFHVVQSLRRLWAFVFVYALALIGAVVVNTFDPMSTQTVQLVFVPLTILVAAGTFPFTRALGATKLAAWTVLILTLIVPFAVFVSPIFLAMFARNRIVAADLSPRFFRGVSKVDYEQLAASAYPSVCPRCSYEMSGLKTNICPECGWAGEAPR